MEPGNEAKQLAHQPIAISYTTSFSCLPKLPALLCSHNVNLSYSLSDDLEAYLSPKLDGTKA